MSEREQPQGAPSLSQTGSCASVAEDLALPGIIPIGADERLWKIYLLRPRQGQATGLEHRIYTLLKGDGHLTMITFAAHRPSGDKTVRSAVARVPDLTIAALDKITGALRADPNHDLLDFQEIDLSDFSTLPDQIHYLAHGC
jgi:hypothetical protein